MKRRELQALCKQHGLPAGGTNAALVARLADAKKGAASAEDEERAMKGCLKHRPDGGSDLGLGETKKVSFNLEVQRRKSTRLQPQVTCASAETAGGSTDVGSVAAEASVTAQECAVAPVRRSTRRNSVAAEVCAAAPVTGTTRRNSVASDAAPVRRTTRRSSVGLGVVGAVEVGETVAVDSKQNKQRSQEKEEETAVGAQVVVPCRVTRRSSLSSAVALLPPLDTGKKQRRVNAADGKNRSDGEAHGSAEARSPAVAGKNKKGRKRETSDPEVQESAKMEAPVVNQSKKRRRTTGPEQLQAELPADLEVPKNDAPITRTLRNEVAQVKNTVAEETHVAQELESKRQPRRSSTRPNQQLASSNEEEDQQQVPVPSKYPPLRRSRRSILEPNVADSNTENLNGLPREINSAKGQDDEKKLTAKEPVRRLTRRSVVSAMLEKGDSDLVAEKAPKPETRVTRATRKSFVLVKSSQDVSEGFENDKDVDIMKQPAVKEPARRSTRKSVISTMLDKEDKNLKEKKSPEANIRTLKRKSDVLIKDSRGDGEETHDASGKDVVKQPLIKEPLRRLTRKSVASAVLEKEKNALVAAKKPEAHDMFSNENQDHTKMARNEDKGRDEEMQEKREGPVRLPRRSIATVETISGKLDQSSTITGPLQHNGHVLEDKLSRDVGEVNFDDNKGIQVVNDSSEILNASSSRSTTAELNLDAEILPVFESPTANGNIKPLDAEVSPIVSSCYNGVMVIATEPQFAGQKDSHGVRTADRIQESHSVEQRIEVTMEMSSDEHFAAEKNMRLVADNLDDEHTAIQVKQGAIQEGTLEKSSLTSTEPEHKHECRLLEETGLHSVGSQRCSSRAEQSPSGLQSLFSQENLDDSMKHVSLAYETSRTKSGVDQLKDCPTKCTNEENALLQPISNHDIHLVSEFNDCMYMSQQNNGIEEISHEGKLGSSTSSLAGILVNANHRKEVIKSVKLVCKGEGNRNNSQSEDMSGTLGNPSFDSALHERKGASFEEIEQKMKNYIGACPSNPKELLLELQSTPSKGNIKESDLDSLAIPISGFVEDESAIITQRVKVHSGSNLSRLKPNDFLDESVQCSNTGVLHQGHKNRCNGDSTEEQVGSGPWTYDTSTVQHIESEVDLLPIEERSKFQDEQLSTQESPKAEESSLNDDVRDILDNGSVDSVRHEKLNTVVLQKSHNNRCNVNSTQEQVDSGHWTYDSTDATTVKNIESEVDLLPVKEISTLRDGQLPMQESAKAVESSLNNNIRDISDKSVCYKGFLYRKKSVSTFFQKKRTVPALGGSAGNSLFGSTPSNKKHKGVLSEEAVNAVNNYVGTCPSNPKELFIELQTSSETFEDANLLESFTFPDTEREGDESTTCHLDNLLATALSSEPSSCLGLSQNFSADEGKQGCMSVSLFEDEGLLKSNYLKDTHAHMLGDAHNVVRDISTEEVLCEKKEFMASMQSSDCDILHENSHSKQSSDCDILHENSHSKGYGTCQSSGWMHTDENNSKMWSCEAEALCQDRVQECHEVNEYQVLRAVPENDRYEAAAFERTESKIMLLGEGEKCSFDGDKNTDEILSNRTAKNSMSELPKDCHLNSCQKQEVLDVFSGPKCPEESTECQKECVLDPGTSYTKGPKCTMESSSTQLTSHLEDINEDQYNENNEHQTTPGFPATRMSEGALLSESGSVAHEASAAGSSALPDEQFHMKLVGPEMEEHNCVSDKDASSLFDPELAGESRASFLPQNTQSDPSSEHDLRNVAQREHSSDHSSPHDLSGQRSPNNL